jgi:hypothetical protein
MQIFLLILIWSLFFSFSYWRLNDKKLITLDPSILFFGPQLVVLLLLFLLDIFNFVVPQYKPSYLTVWVLSLWGVAYLFGSELFREKTGVHRIIYKKSIYSKGKWFFEVAFYLCFLIGFIGSYKLLSGMGVNIDQHLFILFLDNMGEFEKGFFNSSFTLMWQANIAALFWFNFTKKTKIKYLLVLIIFFEIMLRGAYIYIVIGMFYLITPIFFLSKNNENLSKYVLFFIILLNSIMLLSYSWEGDIFQHYVNKIYPYTVGNFVNLFYYIDLRLLTDGYEVDSIGVFLEGLGFSSILLYLDKYFDLFLSSNISFFDFLSQSKNEVIYGNTSTLYGPLTIIPFLVAIVYLFFLGFLSRIIYNQAASSLFFMSVYSWISAATFLSFATGGHFSTTRFFPALLFIWPFLLNYAILYLAQKGVFFRNKGV